MKKNIGNITAAMAVFMAVAGFGIGSRAGSFEVRPKSRRQKQEAKADDKKSTDSDAKKRRQSKNRRAHRRL